MVSLIVYWRQSISYVLTSNLSGAAFGHYLFSRDLGLGQLGDDKGMACHWEKEVYIGSLYITIIIQSKQHHYRLVENLFVKLIGAANWKRGKWPQWCSNLMSSIQHLTTRSSIKTKAGRSPWSETRKMGLKVENGEPFTGWPTSRFAFLRGQSRPIRRKLP